MAIYKTPGVFVEEIATLPPSVAEVATAIPAFLGYTERGPRNEPVRIDTLLDYESVFGGARRSTFAVQVTASGPGSYTIDRIDRTDTQLFRLYPSLKLFFDNGGGSCYVVSVGAYAGDGGQATTPAAADFEAGLAALAQEDEPTLLVMPDAVALGADGAYGLYQKVLMQCGTLKDRFALLDVVEANGVEADAAAFRTAIGTENLKYGAAYYPSLQTTLAAPYDEAGVRVRRVQVPDVASRRIGVAGVDDDQKQTSGFVVTYAGPRKEGAADADRPGVEVVASDAASVSVSAAGPLLTITLAKQEAAKKGTDPVPVKNTVAAIVRAFDQWKLAQPRSVTDLFGLQVYGTPGDTAVAPVARAELRYPAVVDAPLSDPVIRQQQTSLYNQVKAALAQQRLVLPASGAVAGVYARVDRERGVWKAPANVGLASVLAPAVKVTERQQDDLNVDPTAGKSINAIRSFAGRGILIWGARTLAGNDNEWRYVNVRRLFIMIEESVEKATAFAVFEANDAATWLKVRAMIESFLYGLWEQGALAGPTPEKAYYVHVGLGQTMTAQDILEGRMIVTVGVAAVRPAEFIVLRFMHKMQEA